MDDSEGRARARRERMRIRKTRLGDEEDLDPVRGVDAIRLLTALSRQAWALSGQPFPEYPREEIPVAFVPRRDGE